MRNIKRTLWLIIALLVIATTATSCTEDDPCTHDDPKQITIYEAKEPTCSENGLTEGKKCNVCGTVIVAQKEVAATGCVNIEALPEKAPTCQSVGLTEGTQCKDCFKVVIPQIVIPIADCIESDWIIDSEPTTDADGSKHTECTTCHKIIKQESIAYSAPIE